MSFRSPKLLQAAKDQTCTLCFRNDGTTVSAHSNQPEHGKGVGLKAPDYFSIMICGTCHAYLDGRIGKLTRAEKRDMWHRAFARTVERWFQQGIVVVK